MRAGIYAANLHNGGGATGAATFINDLPELHDQGYLEGIVSLDVVVSKAVASNLSSTGVVARVPGVRLTVRDDPPRLAVLWTPRIDTTLDAQLIVRGPHYAVRSAERTVLGFADGTMYFPGRIGIQTDPLSRAKLEGKNMLKRHLMSRYDEYVVQTDRLAERLRRDVGGKLVWVVPNSPSTLFNDSALWESTPLPAQVPGSVRLFYPARGYAHKNHALIGAVGGYLKERYRIVLEVVTTLRDYEYAALSPNVRRYCTNVGEVTLNRCPRLYEDCEGVFFPSLNETSSATPLEGMLMRRPVLASDRDFIRDIAGVVPFYFDPLDASAAGDTIMQVFREGRSWSARLAEGQGFVRNLPSPFERSRAYIRLLKGE